MPWHLGNPILEQRRFLSGDAAVLLDSMCVLVLRGPDALSFLNAVTTQNFARIQADLIHSADKSYSTSAFILNLQGKIQYELWVLCEARSSPERKDPQSSDPKDPNSSNESDTVWLIVPKAVASEIAEYCLSVRFRKDFSIDLSESMTPVGVLRRESCCLQGAKAQSPAESCQQKVTQSTAASVLLGRKGTAGLCKRVWYDLWPSVAQDSADYSNWTETSAHPGEHLHFAVCIMDEKERNALQLLIKEGQISMAGTHAVEAAFVAAGRVCMLFVDKNETFLPHELDLLRTSVSLKKGCYRGQEAVAKVHNLGHPPRRLVMLDFADACPVPAKGAPIFIQEANKYVVVGVLLNAILHHTDGLIGLGVVRRLAPIDLDLYIANGSEYLFARQVPIVRQDAGAAAGISHEEKQALRKAAKARGNTTKTDKSTDK